MVLLQNIMSAKKAHSLFKVEKWGFMKKTLLLLFMAVVAIVYLLFPSEEQLANTYEKDQDYEKSIAVYEDLLKQSTSEKRREILEKLLFLYQKQNQHLREIEVLSELLSLEFSQSKATRIAKLQEEQGNYDEAIALYKNLSMRFPQNIDYYEEIGKLYQWQKEPGKAYQNYLRAEKHLPNHPLVLKNLWEFSQWREDFPAQIRVLKKRIEGDPSNFSYRYQLIQLYWREKQKTEALEAMEQLTLLPLSQEQLQKVAQVYEEHQELSPAYSLYEKIFSQNPNSELARKLIGLTWSLPEVSSEETYLRILEYLPEEVALQKELGEAYLGQGKFPQAIFWLNKVKDDLDPENRSSVLKSLEQAYLWNDQYLESIQTMEIRISDEPGNTVLRQELIGLYEKARMKAHTLLHWQVLVKDFPEEENYSYQYVLALQANGKVEKASQVLAKLIEEKPQNAYWKLQAELYYSQHKLSESVQSYENFISQAPNIPLDIFQRMAFFYEREEKYEKLSQIYESVLSENPSPLLRQQLIEIYLMQGNLSSAIFHMEHLRKTTSLDKELTIRLAFFYKESSQLEKAFFLWEELQQKYPEEPMFLSFLINNLEERGEKEKMLVLYEEELEKRPGNHELRRRLMYAYLDSNKREQALKYFEYLFLRQQLSRQESLDLVFLYQERKNYEKAIFVLENIKGSSLEDKLLLAELYSEAGDWPKAAQVYSQVTKNYPLDRELKEKIGFHYLWNRDFLGASPYFQEILQVEPKSQQALKAMGLIAMWKQNFSEAQRYFSQCIEEGSEDLEVYFMSGELFYERGEKDKGYQRQEYVLQKIRKDSSSLPEKRMYARILFRREEIEPSLALYRELLEEFPRDIDLVSDYGEVLILAQRYEEILQKIEGLPSDLQETMPIKRLKARLYIEMDEPAKAETLLLELKESYPEDVGIMWDLAYLQNQKGKWKRAFENYKEILRLTPDHLEAQKESRKIEQTRKARLSIGGSYRKLGDDTVIEEKSEFSWYATESLKLWGGEKIQWFEGDTLDQVTLEEIAVTPYLGFKYFWENGFVLSAQLEAVIVDEFRVAGELGLLWQSIRQEQSVEVQIEINRLWQDPVAAAALNGVRHNLKIQGEQNWSEDWFSQAHLEASYFSVESLVQKDTLEAYEYAGGVSFGRRILTDPFFSLSINYRHLRQNGDDELFELLPMVEKSDSIFLSAYYEKALTDNGFFALTGNIGTDPSRNVDIFYAFSLRTLVWWSRCFSTSIECEFSSENLNSEVGVSQFLRGEINFIF